METLRERITKDIKDIQRQKDSEKLLVMRTLNSEILTVEKKLGRASNDDEVIEVITSTLKYRKENKEYAEKNNDTVKVQVQENAIELLMKYMPKQLSDEEARIIIKRIIENNGLSGKKDMGKAMKVVIPELNGKFDRKKINVIVSELLG